MTDQSVLLRASTAVAVIIVLGFAIRAVTFKAPLLDHHAWRQADTAAVSRNFARDDLNPFHPQVDWRGGQASGRVETGFELFAFLVAVLSLPMGFNPETGRLLAAVLFIPSAAMVHGFTKRRYGEPAGVVAVFVYAFGMPLAMFFDRAFMNEPLLMCLCVTSIWSAQRYVTDSQPRHWIIVLIATTLIGMVKLPYLIVWAPIAGLFVERDGLRALLRPSLAVMAVVNLAAAAIWYWQAHLAADGTGLTVGLTDKLFDPSLVFSWRFVERILRKLARDVFGITLIFVIWGAFIAWHQKRLAEIGGLLGFLVYVLVVARGVFRHDYYLLPVGMTAAPLAALGILSGAVPAFTRVVRDRALAVLLTLVVLSSFVRAASFHSWYEWDTAEQELCEAGPAVVTPGGRVMFIDIDDPKLMFCLDVKGWLFGTGEPQKSLDKARADGAVAAVAPIETDPGTAAWLDRSGVEVYRGRRLRIVRFAAPLD
jgi:hypothetical protein